MSKEAINYVKFTLDPANPPRMSPEERARFDAIREEDIDYSDIPDQGDATGWVRAVSASDRPEQKDNLVYMDAGVADFFQAADGSGVDQQRVNQVLREYVASQRKAS